MAKYIEEAMKVSLYTRVSTEDQVREGTSLEVQREFLVEFAKRQGWDVFDIAPEICLSYPSRFALSAETKKGTD